MSVMQRIKSEITSWCLGLMFGFHIKNHGKSVKCPNTNGCGTVGQCVGLQGVKKKQLLICKADLVERPFLFIVDSHSVFRMEARASFVQDIIF